MSLSLSVVQIEPRTLGKPPLHLLGLFPALCDRCGDTYWEEQTGAGAWKEFCPLRGGAPLGATKICESRA